MMRAKTYQDFEDESRDQRLFGHITNPVYGNHANKLKVIDAIVDTSCEGSLSNSEAQQRVNDLFAVRETMSRHEWKEAIDLMDCYLQNNLENGVANDVYGDFLNRAGEASIS